MRHTPRASRRGPTGAAAADTAPSDHTPVGRGAAVALVAAGGAIGSVARFLVTVPGGDLGDLPVATLGINIAGAFFLGLLLELLPARRAGDRARLFLGAGVLGGFTTYSLMAGQIAERLIAGQIALAACYALATLLGGLVASSLGMWLGAALRRPPAAAAAGGVA